MISISLIQVKQECTELLTNNLKTSSREISLEVNQILLFVLKINHSQLLLKKTISKAQYEKIKKFASIRATGNPSPTFLKNGVFMSDLFILTHRC